MWRIFPGVHPREIRFPPEENGRLPRWAFLRWVDVARSGWLGDPDVVSLSDGPVIERARAVLHAFAQTRFLRTPPHWLAAHEGQPRDPAEGERPHRPALLVVALDGRRLARLPDLDLLLHRDSDESIRVLALLRRPRDRVLRHVFRVDLLQRGRHGRRDDPIERRRPDGLGRPESRESEPEADRGMGARERDRRTGPPGHR